MHRMHGKLLAVFGNAGYALYAQRAHLFDIRHAVAAHTDNIYLIAVYAVLGKQLVEGNRYRKA